MPTSNKIYTEAQLREAFYSGINYWSPKHGWEEAAFEEWRGLMLYRDSLIFKCPQYEEMLKHSIQQSQ